MFQGDESRCGRFDEWGGATDKCQGMLIFFLVIFLIVPRTLREVVLGHVAQDEPYG